jgi:hypothetical protein
MKCQNKRCGLPTARTITTFRANRKTGKVRKIEGCPSCFDHIMERNLYTGRKIWQGYAAYGVKKTIQKNQDWIEGVAARAAKNRRETTYVTPEAFDAITGRAPIRGQFQ